MGFQSVEEAKATIEEFNKLQVKFLSMRSILADAVQYLEDNENCIKIDDIYSGAVFDYENKSVPLVVIELTHPEAPTDDKRFGIGGVENDPFSLFSNMHNVTAQELVNYLNIQKMVFVRNRLKFVMEEIPSSDCA